MDRNAEIAEKRRRLAVFLDREGLDAVVLTTQAYWSWYTGGGENRVAIGSDLGAAHLVAARERDVVVTTNVEATRIEAEDLAGSEGFEVRAFPWHEEERIAAGVAELTRGLRAASDAGLFGLPKLAGSFARLTWPLTGRECERYRSLGRDCSEAMEESLMDLPRGLTEHEIAGRMGGALLARGVLPQVLLVAADGRTRRHRHPLATSARAEESVMAVVCGKRGGLIASATRMIHFGPVPGDLRQRHDAVADVDAAFITGTRAGRTAGDVFAEGVRAYEAAGFGGEWRLHHQGGATGYQGRSYRARAGDATEVMDRQAFAWNPSIAGTKSEDTILVAGDAQEVLTAPVKWPVVTARGVRRAGVLAL